MKVRCVVRDINAISPSSVRARLRRSITIEGDITDLQVGRIYPVQALEELDGGLWIYLHTAESSEFPHPYPIEMFAIQETTLPADWCIGLDPGPDGSFLARISFQAWASDREFFETLVDGAPSAVALYQAHRRS